MSTSLELFDDVFAHRETVRPPIWMMRQAGRHLPEYRELREGKTFEDLLFSPSLTAEVTLQPVKRYDLDAAIIFSDILLPFYRMERDLKIVPGVGPVLKNRISTPGDVDDLAVPEDEVFDSLKQGIQIVRENLPEKAVIGFAGAPYTLSSYLIEGKSTRDSLTTKVFAEMNRGAYDELLDLLIEVVKIQINSQIEQGVDFVQLFDSWAGHLSPAQYRDLVLPKTKKLVDDIMQKVPLIFYARGSSHLLPVLKDLGASGYSIDHTMTTSTARSVISRPVVIQGNLDPAYLFAGGDRMKKAVDDQISMGMQEPGYIFNLSQGVNKDTPVENVMAVVQQVKGVGE